MHACLARYTALQPPASCQAVRGGQRLQRVHYTRSFIHSFMHVMQALACECWTPGVAACHSGALQQLPLQDQKSPACCKQ